MSTTDVDLTTPTLPLDQVQQHPGNVRFSTVADDEMVDSIRSIGIAQAITVAPAHDQPGIYYVLGGNRRLDGAREAGLTEVPVMVRDDLVTEAQQLEFMLVENLHRADLTPVEEAAAYQQLELFGHDVAAIAAATGRSQANIKSRLRLAGLSDTARDQLHTGQATLSDAEALLEFADDPDTVAHLESQLGTVNFRHAVQQQRDRRKQLAEKQKVMAEYQALGASEITELPEGQFTRSGVCPLAWFRTPEHREPEAHDGCLGYLNRGDSSWFAPTLVCLTGVKHDDPSTSPATDDRDDATRAAEQERLDRERAAREEKVAIRAAASKVRGEWLRDYFIARFPVKSHGDLAKAAAVFLPVFLTNTDGIADPGTLVDVLGLDADSTSWIESSDAVDAAVDELRDARPTKVLRWFGSWLAAGVTCTLETEHHRIEGSDQAQQVLAVWDWLKAAGYELSDVDVEVRTEYEVLHTELAGEEAA